MKRTILIVWQDGRPELERMALQLGERLAADDREPAIRKASEVQIPEILAASAYLFGADEAGSESYGEVARILSGVNLAGRPAAFFGASGSAVAWLRDMTRDAELAASGPDLVGGKLEQSALAALLRAFA